MRNRIKKSLGFYYYIKIIITVKIITSVTITIIIIIILNLYRHATDAKSDNLLICNFYVSTFSFSSHCLYFATD